MHTSAERAEDANTTTIKQVSGAATKRKSIPQHILSVFQTASHSHSKSQFLPPSGVEGEGLARGSLLGLTK